MTRKSLRNLLGRAARAIDDVIEVQTGAPGRALQRTLLDRLRITAKELRDAAAKGIAR